MKFVATHKINHAEKQTVIIAMHYVKEGGGGGKTGKTNTEGDSISVCVYVWHMDAKNEEQGGGGQQMCH